ncbi:ubiquitin carboxyl-terminal hydrolase MINDY-1 isoform X2 [Trichomycterus rosablanca]|uniref:ubiquitin carboxyl-terminal hydrolase MINDY-1 isoform X2 n=1 Tax=Trichomycterus rosablanca TaxID=2290929 RepID=UPI002F35833C
MAEPSSESADGCVRAKTEVQGEDVATREHNKSAQRDGGAASSKHDKDTEALPSHTSTTGSDPDEVSTLTSRSLSEMEDTSLLGSASSVSSVTDDVPSVSTANVFEENGASAEEPQTSGRSTMDCTSEVPPSWSTDTSAEVAQAALPGPAPGHAPGPSAGPPPSVQEYYYVKWITWKEQKTPIITQSENGPCPLLAIMNILFLRWKAKLPAQTEVITIEELMAHLGECVLSIKPRERAEGMELNFQQNVSDAMAVLPKLSTGLDVNVRFTGVTDFEYTPECIVFDLLDVALYHGWLVDPQSPEMASAVGKLSYNQLVEKIIDYKLSSDSARVSEGLIAEQFLESTATQLSYHGLCELNSSAKEGELCVFFRNNHFSTMIKHKGHLYLLVTDQGFLQEDTLVWESLHNVEGDGNFCDSDFRLCHPSQKGSAETRPTVQQQQMQINQDYMVAMSLQQAQGEAPGPLSDLELARQLQQEEYQQPPQASPHTSSAQGRGPAAAAAHGGRRRQGEKKDDSDCSIL